MSFGLTAPPRRRRASLTPMIDVVFLLLVFFLLAARFGAEQALPLVSGGAGGDFTGPPRLVEVWPGRLALNGVGAGPEAVLAELSRLAPEPGDTVVLRGRGGASLSDLVGAMELLRGAGHDRLVLVP